MKLRLLLLTLLRINKILIAHLEDLTGINSEREIMIYLKIDYIQSVILNEIRKNNSEKARESQLSKQHPNLQNEF